MPRDSWADCLIINFQAIVCTNYGPPDVLQLEEIARPTLKANEVRIRVHASTVTAGDVRLRSSTWSSWFQLPARILFGIRRPRKAIPGNELAGEVESVGADVTKFKPGDSV